MRCSNVAILGDADDAKGIVTDEEFKPQLGAERANDLAVLKRLH